jgi:SAM-dependent methyltransferase
MFDLAFLREVREFEVEYILGFLRPGARVLEVGGGTGYQAACMARAGYDVISIDVPDGRYASDKCFPVIDYDGTSFPVEDCSVDIVYSSSVLEHIRDLRAFHREVRRVLRPGGYCVHVMPSGSWRFWSTVTHYSEALRTIVGRFATALKCARDQRYGAAAGALRRLLGDVKYNAVVPRHGESGNALTEIVTFSPFWWRSHFAEAGFEVEVVTPIRLFYTGHMALGKACSLGVREGLSDLLGSASFLYKVVPLGH